jgi:hypothetical protein
MMWSQLPKVPCVTGGCVPVERQSREIALLPDDRVVALRRALYPRGREEGDGQSRETVPLPDDRVVALRRALYPGGREGDGQSRETVPLPDDRVVALRRALYPGGREGGGRPNLNLVILSLYLMTGL